VPASDRLPSALRSTCASQERVGLCLSKRSAPEDLAERGSEDGPGAAGRASPGDKPVREHQERPSSPTARIAQVSTRNSHTRTELPRSRATTTMTSPDSPASAAAVSGHSGWPVNRTLDDQPWWTQQPISGASFSWCPAAASRRISGVTAAGRTAVVRGGQRRAALEDLRGSRGAADESPRGFVEASVVGSSHRLRLELSIICGLVFGGMLGGDHPAASAPAVRSPRPTDAKRPRIKHSTQAKSDRA
jgi:hypothetical protein